MEENKYFDKPHRHKKHHRGHHHGEGVISIDGYAYASKLGGWNPGFKVVLALVLLVFGIAADSMPVSVLILLAMGWLVVGRGGLPAGTYLGLLTIPAAFILMSSLAIGFYFSGTPKGDYQLHLGFFYVCATGESLRYAGRLIVKAMGAVSCMYMMSLTTTSSEIIGVLRTCRVPSLLIELMTLIYRYIFILMEVQVKMSTAAKSRLGYVDLKTSYYTFGSILSNLFIVSLKKANTYYDALESRCYDGSLCFLEEEKPLSRLQAASGTGFVIFLLLVWFVTR